MSMLCLNHHYGYLPPPFSYEHFVYFSYLYNDNDINIIYKFFTLKLGRSKRSISASLVNIVHLILAQTSATHAVRICRRTAFWLEFIVGKKEQLAFRQRNRSSNIVLICVQAILVTHSGCIPFGSLNPTHCV